MRFRSGFLIVEEFLKNDWKGLVFNKMWAEKYVFMVFLGFIYLWNIIGGYRTSIVFYRLVIFLIVFFFFVGGSYFVFVDGENIVFRAR